MDNLYIDSSGNLYSGYMDPNDRLATPEEINDYVSDIGWNTYQAKALVLLKDNDIVAIRCLKANVPYPKEWFDCDIALRAIVHAPSGDPTRPLPKQPVTRPAGT